MRSYELLCDFYTFMILLYLILGSKEVIVRWWNGMDVLRWNGEFTGE